MVIAFNKKSRFHIILGVVALVLILMFQTIWYDKIGEAFSILVWFDAILVLMTVQHLKKHEYWILGMILFGLMFVSGGIMIIISLSNTDGFVGAGYMAIILGIALTIYPFVISRNKKKAK